MPSPAEIAARRLPNFLERAIAAMAPTVALERAVARERWHHFSYDAADPGHRRGDSGGLSKNAHSENPKAQRDRIKLMWDARDLTRNMPILALAKKRLCQYTCGTIRYQAETGNDALNSQIESHFEWWCENRSDLAGRADFRTLVDTGFGGMLVDGDHGLIPVPVDISGFPIAYDGSGRPGSPIACHSLRAIQADRVGNPQTPDSGTNESHTSGVDLDPKTGRAQGFHVYNRTKMSQYRLEAVVPASQFFHLFMPDAADQVRGVTFFAPVLAQARDLYEMFAYETSAAKWAASIAGVIYEERAGMAGTTGGPFDFDGKANDGSTPTTPTVPGKLIRLRGNERVTPFDTGNRPSGAFTAKIQADIDQIAMGLNLPYGFFDLSRFGGVTARLETAQVQRVVARGQGYLTVRWLNPIKNLILADGVSTGHIPAVPGYNKGRWNFGAHMTADVGYQTQANINMLANGLATATDLVGEQGKDFEDVVKTRVNEAALIVRESQAQGLPPEVISQLLLPYSQQMQMQAQMQQSAAQAEGGNQAAAIISALSAVAQGQMPRDQAVQQLVDAGVPSDTAAQIVPTKAS